MHAARSGVGVVRAPAGARWSLPGRTQFRWHPRMHRARESGKGVGPRRFNRGPKLAETAETAKKYVGCTFLVCSFN